jgi:hypothetical protein
LRIVDCEMRIEKQMPKKSEIHNSKSEMGRRMLFAPKLLPPGPQPKHPENVNPPRADPWQSGGFTQKKSSRAAGLITFQDLFQELAGVGVGDLG